MPPLWTHSLQGSRHGRSLKTVFPLFYYGVLALLHVLALPFLLFFSRKPKHRHSIPARFWLWKNPPFAHGEVWMHGCSLGEVNALRPLKERLGCKVSVSATTQTGYTAALGVGDEARYLPFEVLLPFWMKKHKMLLVMEAELWLMLFVVAKWRGMTTVLINARISDKSYTSYVRFRWLYRIIFAHIDKVFAQTEADKIRLLSLGAKEVVVNGNIKTAQIPRVKISYEKPKRRVIVLASTHEGEEALLLEAFEKKPQDMLIVVPRHPERFEKVDALLGAKAQKEHWEYRRFSKEGFGECDLFLCDTMGALVDMYALADVTVLGGSFVEGVGGHNPLEPAFFGNAVISGKHVFNQHALFDQLDNVHKVDVQEIAPLLDQPLRSASLKTKDALGPIVHYVARVLAKS